MRFHPPRPHARITPAQAPLTQLEYEFAQEKASALGRLGSALERTLAALQHFDTDHPEARADGHARHTRAALVAEAGYALWLFMVQREACGLRDPREVMRAYRVPAEVLARMGAWSPQATPKPMRKYR